MPRIWFLILRHEPNPRHQVWLLILLAIFCMQTRNQLCFAPYFSWENFAGTCWGRQKKQVERLFFCIGIIELTHVWSCLAYDFFSILHVFLKKKKKKKKLGRICRIFFSLGISVIACVFTWYLNLLCINLLFLDMIKNLWLHLLSVFLYIQKLDSFFPLAMKMCTIQDSPKGTSVLL